MHTRLFGIGYLAAAVPPSWLQGAPDEVRARLQDPQHRRELRRFESYLSKFGDWSRAVILDNDVWPEYGRRSVAEIARDRGAEPLDAICDLLAATADDVSRLWTIELTFTEDEQRAAFVHPLCVPASDAAALALDGPLANSSFHGAYSWASWFYRYMVRDHKLLSPETAIHKLTGQPAAILGLKQRGVLRPGAFADIAVFDAESFAERETMFDPNQPAVGMRHVLVNGVVAMRDGEVTSERGGRVLRKGRTE
jgi:N-acyl-D-aspartate/D-glutamate deacylase